MLKGKEKIKLIAGTLQSLLETINGMEGLDREYAVELLREELFHLQCYVRDKVPELATNKALAQLDKAFTKAGWDEQGWRWEAANKVGCRNIYLVTFTNKKHTKWEPDSGT